MDLKKYERWGATEPSCETERGDHAGEGGHKLEMGKQVGLYVNSERERREARTEWKGRD